MSQENVEKLRELFQPWDGRNLREFSEAWGSGEIDLSILAPDVAYEDTILPDHVGETYRGHDGVVRATERWAEPFQELVAELDRIVGDGDSLVSVHRVRSRAEHTGIEFEAEVAYAWQFEEGRVVRFRSYWEPRAALESLGLEE